MNSIYSSETLSPYRSDYNHKKRINVWMVGSIALAMFMFVALVGYVVFSPFLSLWGMRNAALTKDGKRFATYIDFPVFKDNLKAEMNAFMMEQMAKDQSMKNNPFAGLGMMIAPTIVNNLVDSLVTPAGVERLMSGEFIPKDPKAPATPAKTENPFTSENYALAYESLNEFSVSIKTPDNKVMRLVFERHWIGDWKLANLKMPR